MRPPQLSSNAPWKQRFRVPLTFTQVARTDLSRGLASSNRSGVFQLYAWELAGGELRQLTAIPTGKPSGVIAPDGRFVYYFNTINYCGSTTFGKAFEESIYGDLGRREVDDMAAARACLVEQGIAQPDAILLTGWFYGDYLTLMGLGVRPELWAGGMAGIAIADWTIQYEDTAATLRGCQEAIFGGSPEQRPDVYTRSSPIAYAEQVRAPVLVIQGRNDTRCPARPMELYEAKLRALGKQIEVDWFDAGHGSYETEKAIVHHELMLRFAYRVLG